jgi:molybdate transport system regulatory protein
MPASCSTAQFATTGWPQALCIFVHNVLETFYGLGHAADVTRLSIRIDFEPSGSALGPGMIQLLECVASKGSIRAAAAEMDMSYRKAWLLIQDVQKTFNGEVVEAAAGGSAGGGTKLTALGEEILGLYRAIEQRAQDAGEAELTRLATMVQLDAPRRRKGRGGKR